MHEERPSERLWERGWDGHQEAQRLRLARLTLAEKLQWLEETQRLIQYLRGEDRDQGKAPWLAWRSTA